MAAERCGFPTQISVSFLNDFRAENKDKAEAEAYDGLALKLFKEVSYDERIYEFG